MVVSHLYSSSLSTEGESEMRDIMEVWRRNVLEPAKTLTIDVEEEEEETPELEPGDEVSIEVVEEEEEYESEKEEKRLKRMGKTERSSWVPGSDALRSLGRGIVEKKKPKTNCHAYSPYHAADDGRFVDPDKERGSYSMKKPDGGSPDDCSWGQSSRKQPNRSRQAVKSPCGRGSKYRCKDGSEKWEEVLHPSEGMEQQEAAYMRGLVQQAVKDVLQQQAKQHGCSFQDLIRAMSAWSIAQKATPPKADK